MTVKVSIHPNHQDVTDKTLDVQINWHTHPYSPVVITKTFPRDAQIGDVLDQCLERMEDAVGGLLVREAWEYEQ